MVSHLVELCMAIVMRGDENVNEKGEYKELIIQQLHKINEERYLRYLYILLKEMIAKSK